MIKQLLIIVILSTFLSSLMFASTQYKKIIIGTYATQEQADKDLQELISELQENQKIVDLQYEQDFYFIARKSGKYYISLIEPFSDEAALKSLLEAVHKFRPGAFANRVDKKNLLRNAKIFQLKNTVEKQKSVAPAQEEIKKEEPKKVEIKKEEFKPTPVEKPTPKKEVAKKELEKTTIAEKPAPLALVEEKIAPQKPSRAKNEVTVDEGISVLNYFQIATVFLIFLSIGLFLYIRHLREKRKELSDMINYQHSEEIRAGYEELDRKEMFLAKVSHELRTPMNAIIGLSHIVLESDLNSLQYSNISKIKQSGEMLLEIVNDILDISKMDAGELKIEKVKFDLNDVLEHVSNMVSLKAQNKGVELIYYVEKDVPSVLLGDPLRVGQIFINLLDNAIKFTKDGSVELKIRKLQEKSDSIVGLEFSVIDTGIGMSEDETSRIFNDFTQADNSISRVYGGTGLGLSITKQLIEMMGGTVDIKSTQGEGTSFIVTIHFTVHEVDNKRYYRLPSKSLMDKNALIVDSNAKSIQSLTNMLNYFHYKVETINTLEEADKFLSQVAYDVLIIDEQKLSKYASELIKLIKAKYDIKIVLIESVYYQNTNNIRHIKEIDTYMMKPFNQNSIFNVILEVYGAKQSQTEMKPKISKEELSVFDNIHILIAEDNVINQRVISGLLEGSGFKLTMASNGKDAIEKLHKNPKVDLILMDINMNIMDGYTATKIIREYKEYDNIPIFALTANSLQKDIDAALECGMQGYLTKPLNIDSLYEKLFTLFSESAKEKKINQEQNNPSLKDKIKALEKLHHYANLDVDLGLANSNNSATLYKTLLKNFIEMYSDAPKVLKLMAHEKRHKDGEYFVHDIKGLSAYLGASKLSEVSASLEEKFATEQLSENSILLNKFTRDLELLLSDIHQYIRK